MATADEVRRRAQEVLRLQQSVDYSMKCFWALGKIAGSDGGPREDSETFLLSVHAPRLDQSRIGTLRNLIEMLRANCFGFAKMAIEHGTARVQLGPGPSAQDLQLMRTNLAALRRMCTVMRNLAEVTPCYMTKLPQMGVAWYLQLRLLYLGHANLECVDALVGHLESQTGAQVKLEIKAAVFDVLSWQDELNNLSAQKHHKDEAAADEAAQRLFDATLNLREAKGALQAAVLQLERLERAANRSFRLDESIRLVTEAENTAWGMHLPGAKTFGDRLLSLWAVQKESVLATSAADLAARLARRLCDGGAGKREQLSAECVASIGEYVLDESKNHYRWKSHLTIGVRDAINEVMQSV